MKQLLLLFILAPVLTAAPTAHDIKILDAWDNSPIGGAMLLAGDTLYSAPDGSTRIPTKWLNQKVTIRAGGYYSRTARITAADSTLLLQPDWYTEPITISAAARPDDNGMPAHNSNIKVSESQRLQFNQMVELLKRRSGIHFKSLGGEGQLQSVSLRGMSAEQTQVLYDDIPINNLQLGMLDLGYIPLGGVDVIDVLRGGSPLLGSSGSIGGALNFKPRPPGDSLAYAVRFQANSLQNRQTEVWLQSPILGLKQSLRIGRHWGDNRYNATAGDESVPLKNRDFNRYSLQWQARYNLSPTGRIGLLVNNFRSRAGAPRAFINRSTEASNQARLSVNNTLLALKYHQGLTRGHFSARLYNRNEWSGYYDPALLINNTPLRGRHFNSEQGVILRWRYLTKRQILLTSGADARYQAIRSSGAGKHSRFSGALYASLDKEWPARTAGYGWHTQLSLRQEFLSPAQSVTLPSAGLQWHFPSGRFYLSYTRNFRAPSFNALYWQPGGNKNLRPEAANGFEGGFDYTFRSGIISSRQTVALYQNRVRDQIVWLPGETYWQPQNIRDVQSRGLEMENTTELWRGALRLTNRLTLNRTIKLSADREGDNTTGNILPYRPQILFYSAIHLRPGSWTLQGEYRYSSFAYTGIENSNRDFLPSYAVVNLFAAFAMPLGAHGMDLSLNIYNLFNVEYEAIKGYPQPTRYAGLGLAIHLN